MAAMVLTERGIKGEGSAPEAHGRVVFLQPWHAEDDVVSGWGDIQAEWFFVACNAQSERVVLCDCFGVASVGEGQGDWLWFNAGWKAIALRELIVDETALPSRV